MVFTPPPPLASYRTTTRCANRDRTRWWRADAVTRAAGAGSPAILFHGDRDLRVPYTQSVRFADALRAAGNDISATIVPAVGHGYDHTSFDLGEPQMLRAHGEATARAILAWLERRFPQPA